MVKMKAFPVSALFLYLFTYSQLLHFTTSKPSGLSLKLIYRDSPESPLYPGNLTHLERMQRLIEFSKTRADYLESFSTSNATIDAKRIVFPLIREESLYYVQVGIGTPPISVLLAMDTGSGLIWTQCEPCINCFRQTSPLYSSITSSTYAKIRCDHPLCRGKNNLFKCVNSQCVYNVVYGEGSSTKGIASLESFTFSPDSGPVTVIDNILFGCSNDNQNFAFAKTGSVSGVSGLSLSPDSLASQLFQQITDKRFSYCLVPFADWAYAYLKFGSDIPPSPGNIQTTVFATKPGSFFYYLNLIDISVGSRRLGFPPNTFKIRRDGRGGCFIDSGGTITRIDETTVGVNAYATVIKAFQKYYDSLKLQRIRGEVPEGFDLCYKYPSHFNKFASMTYNFEGASYDLDGMYVNMFNYNEGYFCIPILPGKGMTILGAWHQQNKRIIYNNNIHALQFYTADCASHT